MRLHAPGIADGELPVNMNPGNGDPWGTVYLGTGWHTAEVIIHDDEDADRLIRALAKLKAMRAMLGTPHPFTPEAEKYGPAAGHCCLCGMLPDSADHAAAAQADPDDLVIVATPAGIARLDAYDADPCGCGHGKGWHAAAPGEGVPCLRKGCGCGDYRLAAPEAAPEPPAKAGSAVGEVPQYRNPLDEGYPGPPCRKEWPVDGQPDSTWLCALPEGHSGQHQAWSFGASLPFAVLGEAASVTA